MRHLRHQLFLRTPAPRKHSISFPRTTNKAHVFFAGKKNTFSLVEKPLAQVHANLRAHTGRSRNISYVREIVNSFDSRDWKFFAGSILEGTKIVPSFLNFSETFKAGESRVPRQSCGKISDQVVLDSLLII